MARLIAPNGATVNVSAEKAKRLIGEGYTTADDAKSTSKKASSSKSEK